MSLVHLILVRGESGTGKGHVSRTIAAHRQWLKFKDTDQYPGIEAPMGAYLNEYQSILLPALPEMLIESELFGHKRGAFTGADKDREGLLAQDFSDILLDEIGDAGSALQGKLLGVLEDRTFLPLGAKKDDRSTLPPVCSRPRTNRWKTSSRRVVSGKIYTGDLSNTNSMSQHNEQEQVLVKLSQAIDEVFGGVMKLELAANCLVHPG